MEEGHYQTLKYVLRDTESYIYMACAEDSVVNGKYGP
jgi:hypothetical protein